MDGAPLTKAPQLPHNFEAEMALLGAILAHNRAYDSVADFLRPEHFADSRHGAIYAACQAMIEQGKPADPITLRNHFETGQGLENVGGAEYLARLAGTYITVGNAADYARAIYDRHLRRELIFLAQDMTARAHDYDLDTDAVDQIAAAEVGLYSLAERGGSDRATSLKDALHSTVAYIEAAFKKDPEAMGLPTGLKNLDRLTGGLYAQEVTILAARPGMGKTALALGIALSAARAAHSTLFLSLEMSTEQLTTRALAQDSGLNANDMRKGTIKSEDFGPIVRAQSTLAEIPLHIDDTPAVTVQKIMSRARRHKRKFGLDLLIVDYLQLIEAEDRRGRSDNSVVTEISRGLKMIAKSLNIPVIALSQLSRALEGRDNKRPMLSDLRDSGSIEQDADVVIFLFREAYYHKRNEPEKSDAKYPDWRDKMDRIRNVAEVIVAKQRQGPTDTIYVHFDGPTMKFSNQKQEEML